jgi:hypothetical protein
LISVGKARSFWSLTAAACDVYVKFWKEFLFAVASFAVVVWVPVLVDRGVSDSLAVASVAGVAFLYTGVLLTTMSAQALKEGQISVTAACRRSVLGLFLWAGALVGLVAVALVPLIVPFAGLVAAVYIYVRLSVGLEIAVIERTNPVRALQQAWWLTKGRFWVAFPPAVLPHVALSVVAMTVLRVAPLVAATVLVLALPAFAIFRVVAYLDLVTREACDSAVPAAA